MCSKFVLQLIEAYATMIECCQLFDLRGLTDYYMEKALTQ